MENIEARLQVLEEGMINLKERLEKLEETQKKDLETFRKEVVNDYDALSREFRELQQDYQISKTSMNKDLGVLKELPVLVQSLKETIQEIKVILDGTKNDLNTVEENLKRESERGKFDFLSWCRDSILPTILGLGILYFILHTVGKI